jgi:hypothetical protein
VGPDGHDPAHRFAQVLGASDELVGAESADQFLVAGSGDGHGAEPAQHGELQRQPAQRAGRARNQQPLAGLQREQVQRLVRGEAVERDGRRLNRRHASRRGRGRDRVDVEHEPLGLRADRRGQQIAHRDHGVAGREPSSLPSAGRSCPSSARSRTGQKRISPRSTPPASPTITPLRVPSG